MEITGFLTAIFTGITAGIAVYNQVKIKQKVYTLWHNSDDCVCIDATICNYNKTPICLYLDEDNVFYLDIINIHRLAMGLS